MTQNKEKKDAYDYSIYEYTFDISFYNVLLEINKDYLWHFDPLIHAHVDHIKTKISIS